MAEPDRPCGRFDSPDAVQIPRQPHAEKNASLQREINRLPEDELHGARDRRNGASPRPARSSDRRDVADRPKPRAILLLPWPVPRASLAETPIDEDVVKEGSGSAEASRGDGPPSAARRPR